MTRLTARGKGAWLRLLGAAALLIALGVAAAGAWGDWSLGQRTRAVLDALPEPAARVDASLIDPAADMPSVEVDGGEYLGVLRIESLGLELPVSATWDDAELGVAPCRYSGTAYGNSLVVVGGDGGSQLGPLSGLAGGEEVVLSDMLGNDFAYVVDGVETLRPTEVDRAVGGEAAEGLTLCVLGSDGKARLMVRCAPALFSTPTRPGGCYPSFR